MSVFIKQFIAFSGVSTIGSPFTLKEVFNKTGTPVSFPNCFTKS